MKSNDSPSATCRKVNAVTQIIFGVFALFLGVSISAQQVTPTSLPLLFQESIPLELTGGLKLVDLQARCNQCDPWRELQFLSPTEPAKVERVSVTDGYRAMYAFPGTHYFANVKIERSDFGHFESDRDVIERALRHECQRKLTRVERYMAETPGIRERVELLRMPGHPYLEVEEGTRNGISYLSCTENAIGLISSTISQVQLFVPSKRLTITAYLLKQEKMNFKNIVEIRKLRDEFIEGYSDFLHEHN